MIPFVEFYGGGWLGGSSRELMYSAHGCFHLRRLIGSELHI